MRAEACLQESFEGFRKLRDHRGLGRTLGQLVYARLEQGKVRKARQAVDALAEVIKPLGSDQENAIHAMLEGLVFRHEGDSAKAKFLLEKSLRIFSSQPGFYTVTCRLELALALRHMGNDDQAIKQLKQTIKESRGLKIHDIEQKAMLQLKDLDKVEWGRLLHSSGRGATDGFVTAERLIVAVVYLDIRELEPYFGETPEAFQGVVNRILQSLESEVLTPDAVIGQVRGGSIQLLFGMEESCDPPIALKLVESFFELMDRDYSELMSQNKMGVAAGMVVGDAVKGTFGSAERRDFDLYGLSVDKARFFASAASTGNILTDESTFRSVLDEDADQAVKVEVVWRGLPSEAYRIKPRVKEVFRGSLAQPIG